MSAKPRLLWLSPHLPWPLDNGSKIRLYHLLQGVRQWAQVDLAVPFSPDDAAHASLVREWVNELLFEEFPLRPKKETLWSKLLDPPRELMFFNRSGLTETLAARLRDSRYDLVECHHTLTAVSLPMKTGTPVAVHFVDWRWKILAREPVSGIKDRVRRFLQTRRAKRIEEGICFQADGAVFMSEEDAALAPAGAPARKSVVPNGVDLEAFPFQREPGEGLLFMGTLNYLPNSDALTWWTRDIAPLLKTAPLTVVGARPSPLLQTMLQNAGQRLYANVPEIQPYLYGSRLLVVPLRTGGGTRLKILQAMSAGRVVISTAIGAEGLGVRHGEEIWLAETPSEFRDAVTRLTEDDDLYARLQHHARKFVEGRFDWRVIQRAHREFLDGFLSH